LEALFANNMLGWGHAGYLWRSGAGMVCPSGTEPDYSHCLHCRPAAPSLRPLQVNVTPHVAHLHACTFLPFSSFVFFVRICLQVDVNLAVLSHLQAFVAMACCLVGGECQLHLLSSLHVMGCCAAQLPCFNAAV